MKEWKIVVLFKKSCNFIKDPWKGFQFYTWVCHLNLTMLRLLWFLSTWWCHFALHNFLYHISIFQSLVLALYSGLLQAHGNSKYKSGRIPGGVKHSLWELLVEVRRVEAVVRGIQKEVVGPHSLLGFRADFHQAQVKVCVEAEGGICLSNLQRGGAQSPAKLLWSHLLLPLSPRTIVRASTP